MAIRPSLHGVDVVLVVSAMERPRRSWICCCPAIVADVSTLSIGSGELGASRWDDGQPS